MFTQSCFIRKNTPELRGRLEEIGYDISKLYPSSECIATSSIEPKAVGISESKFDDSNPHRTWNCAGRIDCNTNEDLFLALVSLRDDTDKNQWFIYDNSDWAEEEFRLHEFFICDEDKIEDFACYDCMYLDCHKATVEELIDYFNSKRG